MVVSERDNPGCGESLKNSLREIGGGGLEWEENDMNASETKLKELLAAWRVEPKAAANFRPEVWARIRRAGRESWAAYVRGHLAGWAAGAAVAAAVAGWTGHAIAQARLESERERMVVSYLSELDPRVLAKLEH